MWVVKCTITGCYLLGSTAKIAIENSKNIMYAKRYHTLSGAKSARGNLQKTYDYWHDTHIRLCDKGFEEYIKQGRNYYLRKFEVIELEGA